MAGRRLANTSMPLRSASKPASGLRLRGTFSHGEAPTAPPTAPISTASDAFAVASVSSVSGTPLASRLAPPKARSSTVRSLVIRSATRFTSAMISGPIPSPGRRSSLGIGAPSKRLAGQSWRSPNVVFSGDLVGDAAALAYPGPRPSRALQPRLRQRAAALVGVDVGLVRQRLADRVEALQQLLLAGRVDLEAERLAGGRGDGLRRQVDREDVVATLGLVHQRLHVRLGQCDRQQAVLEAVAVEDVG